LRQREIWSRSLAVPLTLVVFATWLRTSGLDYQISDLYWCC